ncbi:MAG: TonB-dependent receptor [bacterium]|nr:TonB-dependent receptor [bacterium]
MSRMAGRNQLAREKLIGFFVTALLLSTPFCLGDSGHSLAGTVIDREGQRMAGVRVALGGQTTLTDTTGRFAFEGVPPGKHLLELQQAGRTATREVTIPWQSPDECVLTLDWPRAFQESLTVYSVSRRRERLVEAPAAVTSLLPSELAAQSSSGQLPRLLAFTPSVQIAQSGLYDFNLNTRGYNSAINRRVLTLIDGRQTSVPEFLGVQEWGALSMPLDEFDNVELVRGPSSALYGAGAISGVLDITTKSAKDTPGYKFRLSAGELGTTRLEGRAAGPVGSSWYWRLAGSHQESDHLTRSRVDSVEYQPELLPKELVAPPFDKLETTFASLRFDRFREQSALTLEGGSGSFQGGTTTAPLGRTQADRVRRPWMRVNYNTGDWNLLAFYSGRDGDNQVGLSSGASLYSEGYNTGIELQGSRTILGGRGFVVAGLAHLRQRIDSSDPSGVHGIFADVATAEQSSAFAQVRSDLRNNLSLVASGRLDDNSLHDAQLSMRLGLAYAPGFRHHLRLTFNNSFQSPTLVEFAVRTPAGPVLDLFTDLSLADLLGDRTLGFDRVPQLALGNPDLEVEEIQSWELGYRGGVGKTFLSASLYRNDLTDFTTSILPQVGTSLGRLNPTYGPYRPPSGLPAATASALLSALQAGLSPRLLTFLSNDADGSPILAILSLTNFGKAEAKGLEIELHHFFSDAWQLSLSAAHSAYRVVDSPPENPLLPNAPELQAAASLIGSPAPWSSALRLRWVEGFDWSSGLFRGPVPSYIVADLHLGLNVGSHLRWGLDVANLTNKRHYEIFGGSLLDRRALAHITYTRE